MSAAGDVSKLLALVDGYRATCVIAAALEVGLLDRLARREVPGEEALASELGVHAPSLARLVNGLRALGLVAADGSLTASGRLLAKDLRPWALLTATEYLPAWADLAHSVKTGETAFVHAFAETAWEHRQKHPELGASFDRVMSSAQVRAAAALLDAHDFSTATCVVDVGGGQGTMLAAILKRQPRITGILFDQPHVVAAAAEGLAAAGLADRCRLVGGSFLDAVPAGGDVLLLKHCLHNWSDADCVRILERCRDAMDEGAKLLILEDLYPVEDLAAAAPLVMMDLHMMAVHGGRERTRAEYEALLTAAGLRLERVTATRAGAPDVIVAVRP